MTQLAAAPAATSVTLPPPSTQPQGRIAAVDGLRACAVAGVIAFHLGFGLDGGFLGVDLFFVISGFVITRALIREHRSSGRTDLSHFWKRRFRRIFPTLALVLIVVTVWASSSEVSASFRRAVSGDALAALISSGNWWQIFGPSGYWTLGGDRNPLTHLWSLAVEEQFYVIYPLLFIRLIRYVAPAWRWRVALAATLVSYAYTLSMAVLSTADAAALDRIYLGTDTRSGALLAGCTLALFATTMVSSRRLSRKAVRRRARLSSALAVAAVITLAVLWVCADADSAVLLALVLPLSGAGSVLLIGAVAQAPDAPVARALAWTPLVTIGRWSYALYLWHWVIWVYVQQSPLAASPLAPIITLLVTIVVSVASHYVVELPVLRRGWRWKTIIVTVTGVSLVVAVAAFWTLATVQLPDAGDGEVTVVTH